MIKGQYVDASGTKKLISTSGTANYIPKFSSTSTFTNSLMYDNGAGIGIGTSSPTYLFDVNGTSLFRNGNPGNVFTNNQLLFGFQGGNQYMHAIKTRHNSSGSGINNNIDFYTWQVSDGLSVPGTKFVMTMQGDGKVGIGTQNPISALEVNGAATNLVAYNAGAASTILFSNSNLAYTTANAGAFSLQGLKDGGTYTLAVQGASSGTSTFTGTNPSGIALSFKSINNGPTTASKHTLYTFIVMGTTVYYSMSTGL